ncbi:MAG: hypothetical protein E6K39_18370 [Gammaproteobacteria bacterium]|nr:MAG: hypothetical protein E6K39_18370 [Gammaproteobacteria bacterium]
MIGLDIAKAVFQVHGVDARGQTTLQRRLRRGQRSLPRYISKKTAMRAASRRGPRISLEQFVSSAACSIEGGAAARNSR